MGFFVVQPYEDGRNRLKSATVVRSFTTRDAAFAELKGTVTLPGTGIHSDAIELMLVDERRERVQIGH